MELDSFLASPRWDILQIIAKNPSSPIEIAAKVGTTVSFISQQLKLLEAAGILIKKRTGLVEKGKPRTIFSLKKEIAYIVPLSKEFSSKRTITLAKEHKIILKIWELADPRLQNAVQKFFWTSLSEHLEQINGIYVYQKGLTPKIFIFSKEKNFPRKIKETHKKGEEEIVFQVVNSFSEISKLGAEFFTPIYDPSSFFETGTVLKGGEDTDE